MLSRTLSESFTPGTNVGGRFGASWVFALPQLNPDRVVVIGPISSAARRTLEVHARSVSYVTGRNRGNAVDPASADLLVLAPGKQGFSRWPHNLNVDRILAPNGVVFMEQRIFSTDHPGVQGGAFEAHGFEAHPLSLSPIIGEVGAMFPASMAHLRQDLVRRSLQGMTLTKRRWRPIETGLQRLSRAIPHHRLGLLLARPGVLHPGPPAYVRDLALQAGIDVGNRQWAVSATGLYPSRKVLVLLYTDNELTEVIKVTRLPAFNTRLENEADSLMALEKRGLIGERLWPSVWCRGRVGALTAVGEIAINGDNLQKELRVTGDVELALEAARRIARLGELTRTLISPEAAADALTSILETVSSFYALSSLERSFLSAQIATIANSSKPFPSVFQHGDAGCWNAVVSGPRAVAFLDWEAAEPDGFPLWDLFYLLRSCAIALARAEGTNNATEAFTSIFFDESELGRRFGAVLDEHRRQLDLDGSLIEPLFHTTWLFRMLREIPRLTPATAQTGQYRNILRLCVDRGNDSGLLRFWGADED